jgi:alpha-beta hydrolase superfamily lysophospholipase
MRRFSSLIAFALLSTGLLHAAGLEKARKVKFLTRDGKTLVASYRKPAAGQPVVVLLHGLSSTKEEWVPFTDALGKAGWGSFAYDARGHGASDPDRQGVRSLGAPGPGSQWERMVDDLGAAMRYLEKQGIVRSSVAVCGASLGANVAARYAGLSSPVRSLVLLSPGLDYMEFKPETDIVQIKSPTLIVASADDKYAFSSSLRLQNLAPADTLWTDVPTGHGVQMLTSEFSARLIKWLDAAR